MRLHRLTLALLAILPLSSCDRPAVIAANDMTGGTGILLVSHGSRSAPWREMLMELEEAVRERVLGSPMIDALASAFMEYTEPSIATRLEEFDQAGIENVVIVPLFLTVSSHPFDDVPTIIGAKQDALSIEKLKAEGIRRYTPRAQVQMTPLLDFPSMLGANIERRVRELSVDPSEEGVVLVAYGSSDYDKEWTDLLTATGEHLTKEVGVGPVEHAWCGHIVHYETTSTREAIEAVLARKKRVLVVPVLVAIDEDFQGGVIADAVTEVGAGERVVYIGDSILPDPMLEAWVVEITHDVAAAIEAASAASAL